MSHTLNRRHFNSLLSAGALTGAMPVLAAADMPLFDAHIHYSHDAWERVPPKQAVAILRQAGLRGALVSSSNDQGTQMLLAEAPDLIVAELRPYRSRGETSTWVRDDGVPRYLEQRLAQHRYVGIGEFHVDGANTDLPVPRRMVALARERGLLLHAHSDADAIERLFRQWPEARVLWAHAGFAPSDAVGVMLRRHSRLWCDLAFRGDHASGNKVEPAWRETFTEFPQRFMVGTDTYTPERWHAVAAHASYARGWLADLPAKLAQQIGWGNAETLLRDTPRPPA